MKRYHELLNRIPDDRDVVGAEVGVWRGQTSRFVLRARPRLKMYMIDRWAPVAADSQYGKSGDKLSRLGPEEWQEAFQTVQEIAEEMPGRAIIMRGESDDIAKTMKGGSLDFVFIDSDHSYEGCLSDLIEWVPLVRRGGTISGHDYANDVANDPDAPARHWGVKRAVDYYVRKYCGGCSIVLAGDHTFFFRRPKEGGIKK